MKRLLLLLPLVLLATSCGGYIVFPTQMTLGAGETASAHVGYRPYGGGERRVVCFSSDTNVMAVSQADDLTVTIAAS